MKFWAERHEPVELVAAVSTLAYIARMRLVAAASLVVLGTGCSWAVADEVGEGGERDASVQGTMHVESVVSYGLPSAASAGEQVRSQVTARFLRVEGLDGRTADELVGATVLPARPGSEVSQLGCSYPSEDGVPSAGGNIELLDVGEIWVHATHDGEADTLALAARAFPPVGDMISGVVYTSRDDATALPAAGSYLIETSGSASVEGFSIQVDAPPAPLDVLVSGVPINELGLDTSGEIAVGGDGWTIHWTAASPSEADIMYVEIARVDGSDDTLRCVFEDDGFGNVPAAYLGHAPGTELEIAVHRYRQTQVRLAGFDGAYVDFDFAVSARVLIQ